MSFLTPVIGMMQEAGAQGAAQAADAAGAVAAAPVDARDIKYDYDPSFWLPQQAADAVESVDGMFNFIMWLSIVCFVGIAAAVVYFTWKYRARPGHKTEPSPSHNDKLEITWTVIPSIIVVFIFLFGWRGYLELSTPPKNALEIQVKAWKWNWEFTHYNGVKDNVLHVPKDTPVRLIMNSQDVLHSFYVPAFRVKQDVVPKRYTQLWFKPTKVGTYRLYCTEYCGMDHSMMKTVVVVHDKQGYKDYLQKKYNEFINMPPDQLGAILYKQKGCSVCHSIDGSDKAGGGPSFKGYFGKQQAMTDGSSILVDENYLRESILQPTAKIRQGYPPVMPKLEISDPEIDALIAYIKSLNK